MNIYRQTLDYQGAYIAVIMNMLDVINGGVSPIIMRGISEAFDFVRVEDCGLSNVCTVKVDTADRKYNVRNGERTSLRELAELIVDTTGFEKPIQCSSRSQSTLVRRRTGCPKKAGGEIGFAVITDLRDSLERLIAWCAKHTAEVRRCRKAVGLPV